MRLITHNLLVCNRKTCQAPGITNFPLKLVVQKWQDFDDESTMPCTRALMSKLAEKLDWEAFINTVRSVSICKNNNFSDWHSKRSEVIDHVFVLFFISLTGDLRFLTNLKTQCLTMKNLWPNFTICCSEGKFRRDH